MIKAAEKIIEYLQSEGYEGDVLAFKEERISVKRELGLKMGFSRRGGFSTRWRESRKGVFFHFSTSPAINPERAFIISEAVELPLPSRIRKSAVKLRDERGLPVGEEIEFPDWIFEFGGIERSLLIQNTRGAKSNYSETLFFFRGEIAGEELFAWSRKRDFPKNIQSPGGKYLVLHPLASFKLIRTLLSGEINIKGFPASIIENPAIDYAPGSHPFDASGRDMKRRLVFKKGKIKAQKPIHLLRKTPDSPPSLGWTNIIMELPTVSCDYFILVLNLKVYGTITELITEDGKIREINTDTLLSSVSGKIRDGWFIGPPFIKSDYILLSQYS